MFILINGLYKYQPKFKSTSFYYCVEVRGHVIINTQSKNLFLVIDKVASRDNSGELTDRKVLPITKNKKPLTLINKDTIDK